ncbi:MAG: protease modulator HflC [Proteobacteria bacterium]|nr:protease modulator HflC [Pseudomonadota bacterium]
MNRKIITAIVVAIVVLILGSNTFYTIAENEQIVVVQFGKVLRLERASGLNWKVPFLEQIVRYDERWIDWDGDPNQITTRDKRYIAIDAFARWRIADPLVFIEKLRDEISAQGRLDDIIDSATRNIIANNDLIEAIRTTDRQFVLSAEEKSIRKKRTPLTVPSAEAAAAVQSIGHIPSVIDALDTDDTDAKTPDADTDGATDSDTDTPKANDGAQEEQVANAEDSADDDDEDDQIQYIIHHGRVKLTQMIQARASAEAAKLGIELKDVQIKRINYVASVQASVFDRMISERRKVATRMRSEGEGLSAEILGRKERELKVIRSEAYRIAEEIKGEADAEAAHIYAQAYQKDPELYEFLKTLETYRQTIGDDAWLLLTTSSDYGRYIKAMK